MNETAFAQTNTHYIQKHALHNAALLAAERQQTVTADVAKMLFHDAVNQLHKGCNFGCVR